MTMKSAVLCGLCALLLAACATSTAASKDDETSRQAPGYAGPLQPDLAPVSVLPETVLIRGGTVLTAAGRTLAGGSVLLEGGRIAAVSEGSMEPPAGAQVIDATGKFVTPGLIDAHSHLGVYPAPGDPALSDGNEASSPVTPDVRAEHGFWPQDPQLERALRGGVTALQVLPGSANLIGGRSAPIKLHPGISSRAMRFPGAPWGLKMACGENPKRVYGARKQRPWTRMGNMAMLRAQFQKAREYDDAFKRYRDALAEWEREGKATGKRPAPPPRDLGLETLAAAVRGEILVHVHCYRADEMIQLLELADEFGFEIRSFEHAVEAYKIRDVLAAKGVAVSTWADWWGFKLEAQDAIPENAGLVTEAGGRAIIHSDSAIGIQRLNQEAAKAYYAAMRRGVHVTEDDALRAVTLNPAWSLGVDDQTGSLEEGKAADVVIWSAHPLSVYARAEIVFVDGVRELDLSRPTAPWSDFELGDLPGVEEGLR